MTWYPHKMQQKKQPRLSLGSKMYLYLFSHLLFKEKWKKSSLRKIIKNFMKDFIKQPHL